MKLRKHTLKNKICCLDFSKKQKAYEALEEEKKQAEVDKKAAFKK